MKKPVVSLFSIGVVVFCLTSCSPKPSGAQAQPDPKKSPQFLEIIYELDNYLFPEERPIPEVERGETISGYFFDPNASSDVPVLVPAMAREWPQAEDTALWIGCRIYNHVTHRSSPQLSLMASRQKKLALDAGREAGFENAYQGLSWFKNLLVPVPMTIELKGKTVSASCNGRQVILEPGQSQTLFLDNPLYSRDFLAEQLLAAWAPFAGDPQRVDAAAAREEIHWMYPGKDVVPFNLRVSVRFHGSVQIAPVDALSLLDSAKEKLASGPYEEAGPPLERLLVLAPTHREVLRLWDTYITLIDEKAVPSRIEGRLVFPEGQPTPQVEELWKRYHAGMASLASPEGLLDRASAVSRIQDGAFTFAVPGDAYRLTVRVPGFKRFEQILQVKGTISLDVPLETE